MQTYFSYFVPLVKGNKMNDLNNHDKRIPYYELLLERDLDAIAGLTFTAFSENEGINCVIFRLMFNKTLQKLAFVLKWCHEIIQVRESLVQLP